MPENTHNTGAGATIGSGMKLDQTAKQKPTREQAQKLIDQGYNVDQIAQMFGMTKKPQMKEVAPYAEPTFKNPFENVAPAIRNIGKPMEEREQVDPMGFGKTLAQTVGNIPSAAYNVGAGAVNTIASLATQPVDTIKAMSNSISDLFTGAESFVKDDSQTLGQKIKTGVQVAGQVFTENPDVFLTAGPSNLTKVGVKSAGKVASSIGETTLDLAKYSISKASGIGRDTIENIIQNPKQFGKAQAGIISREKNLQIVGSAIDKRIDDLSETGKGYEAIRQSGMVVDIPFDDVVNTLESKGIEFNSKGNMVFNPTKTTMTKQDFNALNDLIPYIKGKSIYTADEVLNIRKQLDNIGIWQEGKTAQSKLTAQSLRKLFDDNAKQQIPELGVLDAQYRPQLLELKQLKTDFIDSKTGDLKDNAMSKLSNLTNKGNEKKLARVEQLVPGISEKIKAVKSLEDIEYIKGRSVGTYMQGAAGSIFGFTSGGVPGMIMGYVITSPTIMTEVLKLYGNAKGMISEIANKMKIGKKLSQSEQEIISSVLKDINDGTVIQKAISQGNKKLALSLIKQDESIVSGLPNNSNMGVPKLPIKGKEPMIPARSKISVKQTSTETQKAKKSVIKTKPSEIKPTTKLQDMDIKPQTPTPTSTQAPTTTPTTAQAPTQPTPVQQTPKKPIQKQKGVLGLSKKGGVNTVAPMNQVKYNQGDYYAAVRMALSDTDADISSYGALSTKIKKMMQSGNYKDLESFSDLLKLKESNLIGKGLTKEQIIKRVQQIKDIAKKNRHETKQVLVDLRGDDTVEQMIKANKK